MNRIRIAKIGVLMLGVAALTWSMPAQAGFEFTGPTSTASKEVAPEDAIEAPMPIVPMPGVTAEPLSPLPGAGKGGAPNVDRVLSAPVSRQQETVIKAPKGQPMDMDALLKATENGDMVTLEGYPRPNLAAQNKPAGNGPLVINPYPLESAEGATHGGGMGKLATEQALMEQGGSLRTIAVPGGETTGMIARAKISSRYDKSEMAYLDRTPASDDAAMMGISSVMTPIPGGEAAPLNRVSAIPLPPPVPREAVLSQRVSRAELAPSAMPRPAIPESYPQPSVNTAPPASGAYAEAIGFGRDLPLALALSQVVPPEYTYAFGTDIDAGSNVSWQGGKPWNEVLNDMLASQNLRAVISGTQVTIVPAGRSA